MVPTKLEPLFSAAGWRPGRSSEVRDGVPERHPAYAILAALGGLKAGRVGPGAECATSDVEFGLEDEEEQVRLSSLLGLQLVTIAEFHVGHGILLIDENGRCFCGDSASGDVSFAGEDFSTSVERLLLGYRLQPMLLPGQDEVVLYGDTFRSGDPAIYSV